MKDLHVIIGLGVTGFSTARFLKSENIPFAMVDTRQHPQQLDSFKTLFPDVEIHLGSLETPLLDEASCLVVSPGMSIASKEIKKQIEKGKSVIGDVQLFRNKIKKPIIAITGTNAKSTVTTLVGEMAEEAGINVSTGGNLGEAVLDLYAKNPHADLFVLELSSFQLETTHSLNASVASILNITPDHMDRYETYHDYQIAKHRIYQGALSVVCNEDDDLTQVHHQNKLTFTLNTPSKKQFGLLEKNKRLFLAYENEILLDTAELPVPGKHYQANALAAFAMGKQYGLPIDAMISVLKRFKGLPHRCQLIRKSNDIYWYNDSKGTNVGATIAAIEGLGPDKKGNLILIAGGIGKDADFSLMIPAIKKYISEIVLIGKAASDLFKTFDGHVRMTHANSMEEAVLHCYKIAKKNDSILLSPACASFDMFKNFEHRGEVFTELVNQLPA